MNESTQDLISQGIELMATQRYDAAKAVFERAVAADPTCYEAQMHFGNACESLGQHDEGIATFKRALILRPDSGEARYSLGCAQFLAGNNVEALKEFNRCEKDGFASVEMYGIMEVIFADAKDLTQAVRCANRAIALAPLNPRPYLDKAQLFLLANKPAEAISTLHEVEELLPDAGDPYLVEARIHRQLQEFDEALAVVARARARFPEDGPLAVEEVRLLNDKGDHAAAVAKLGPARGLAAGSGELLRELDFQEGIARSGLQDVDGSVKVLEHLAQDEKAGAEALFLLVSECYATERFEEAAAYGERLASLEGAEARLAAAGLFWASMARRQLGRESDAAVREVARRLRKVTIAQPGLVEVYVYRALCHRELGEYDRALALADHLITLAPQAGAGHRVKADILEASGDAAAAASERARADELDAAAAQA